MYDKDFIHQLKKEKPITDNKDIIHELKLEKLNNETSESQAVLVTLRSLYACSNYESAVSAVSPEHVNILNDLLKQYTENPDNRLDSYAEAYIKVGMTIVNDALYDADADEEVKDFVYYGIENKDGRLKEFFAKNKDVIEEINKKELDARVRQFKHEGFNNDSIRKYICQTSGRVPGTLEIDESIRRVEDRINTELAALRSLYACNDYKSACESLNSKQVDVLNGFLKSYIDNHENRLDTYAETFIKSRMTIVNDALYCNSRLYHAGKELDDFEFRGIDDRKGMIKEFFEKKKNVLEEINKKELQGEKVEEKMLKANPPTQDTVKDAFTQDLEKRQAKSKGLER